MKFMTGSKAKEGGSLWLSQHTGHSQLGCHGGAHPTAGAMSWPRGADLPPTATLLPVRLVLRSHQLSSKLGLGADHAPLTAATSYVFIYLVG